MRSPRGQTPEIWFCAQCQADPSAPPRVSQSTPSSTNESSRLSVASASTALTEPSRQDEDSDTEFELPPLTEEARRRQEQSDRASSELASRLLKGWSMLAEECPNDACFGVPLVRPPNVGGEKSHQKVRCPPNKNIVHIDKPAQECVICGNVYVSEGDRLVLQKGEESIQASTVTSAPTPTTIQRSAPAQEGTLNSPPVAKVCSSQSITTSVEV